MYRLIMSDHLGWHGDGDFNDPDELVINIDDSINPLPSQVNFNVPTAVIDQQAFGVRLRISNTDMESSYGQVARDILQRIKDHSILQ